MNVKELKDIQVDYDSPVDVIFQNAIDNIASAFAKSIDDGVMNAVVKAGFNINKEKLEQVLSQDKCRYEEAYRRGYTDGYKKREDEIVRCKDCKYQKDPHCWVYFFTHKTEDDWFCADGKPKDGEAD